MICQVAVFPHLIMQAVKKAWPNIYAPTFLQSYAPSIINFRFTWRKSKEGIFFCTNQCSNDGAFPANETALFQSCTSKIFKADVNWFFFVISERLSDFVDCIWYSPLPLLIWIVFVADSYQKMSGVAAGLCRCIREGFEGGGRGEYGILNEPPKPDGLLGARICIFFIRFDLTLSSPLFLWILWLFPW